MDKILAALPTNNFYTFCTYGAIFLVSLSIKGLLAQGSFDRRAMRALPWIGLIFGMLVGCAGAYAWLTRTQRFQDLRDSGQSVANAPRATDAR